MKVSLLPASMLLGIAFILNGAPGRAQARPASTPLPPSMMPSTLPSAVAPSTVAPSIVPSTSPSIVPAAMPAANVPIGGDVANSALKAGDRLRIVVVGFPDLSGEQSISTEGTIQLPMAGAIAIAGLDSTVAVESIQTALKPYVRRPQVGLSVLGVSPLRITVTGEVLQPGPRLLDPARLKTTDANNNNNFLQSGTNRLVTLSDAIGLAGGITPQADLQNVVIRRWVPSGAPVGQQRQYRQAELKVDLWQAIKQGDLTADARLQDGDEIVVPMAQISSGDRQKLLTSTFAPNRITVQVVGEVQRPGPVEIAPNSGVSQAIGSAGGLTRDAKKDQIALFRVSAAGKLESQNFDFVKDSGSLQTGDLIVVGKKGSSSVIDFLGRVLSPLGSIFYLLK
jgi:polysaccharide biosynthesis/export protein